MDTIMWQTAVLAGWSIVLAALLIYAICVGRRVSRQLAAVQATLDSAEALATRLGDAADKATSAERLIDLAARLQRRVAERRSQKKQPQQQQ